MQTTPSIKPGGITCVYPTTGVLACPCTARHQYMACHRCAAVRCPLDGPSDIDNIRATTDSKQDAIKTAATSAHSTRANSLSDFLGLNSPLIALQEP